MRGRWGLTEQLWDSLSREQQISWKFFMYALAAVASLMIDATGIAAVDWLLKIFTGFIALLIIESQRNLRRYKSAYFRKTLLRLSVFLGTSAFGLLICSFFLTVSFHLVKIFMQIQMDQINWMHRSDPVAFVLVAFMGFLAVGKAIFNQFQQLKFTQMISEVQKSLKALLVDRPFYMTPFPLFALFEFSVVLFSYLYVSMASAVVSTIRATALL